MVLPSVHIETWSVFFRDLALSFYSYPRSGEKSPLSCNAVLTSTALILREPISKPDCTSTMHLIINKFRAFDFLVTSIALSDGRFIVLPMNDDRLKNRSNK